MDKKHYKGPMEAGIFACISCLHGFLDNYSEFFVFWLIWVSICPGSRFSMPSLREKRDNVIIKKGNGEGKSDEKGVRKLLGPHARHGNC